MASYKVFKAPKSEFTDNISYSNSQISAEYKNLFYGIDTPAVPTTDLFYTIPAGKKFLIYSINLSLANNSGARYHGTLTTVEGGANVFLTSIVACNGGSNSNTLNLKYPIEVGENQSLYLSGTTNSIIVVNVMGYLIDKDYKIKIQEF